MNAPLVSAIVPSYNHERFVGAALESLARQTHGPLELIVVDDGSTDGTFDRVQALRPELDRRFVRVEALTAPHRGIGATIEACLSRAKSNLIYMLDSDDVAAPHAIEALLPLLDPPDVALAVGDNDFIDGEGSQAFPVRGEQAYSSFLAYYTAGRQFDAARDFGTYGSLIAGNYVPNGWLFKAPAFREIGGYRQDVLLDDWELLLRLVKRFRVAFTPETLLRYRLHATSTNVLHQHRMVLDTARILLREWTFCAAHDYQDAWQSHANQALPLLSRHDFFESPLLLESFPSLTEAELDALQALAATLTAQTTQARPGRPKTRVLPAGSAGERIHLYAACWNDLRMLPFFFRHYDPFVERYVIFDDGSDDGSIELLRSHDRVELRTFEWTHPDSFVLSELDHYNSCWKESRGHADWVIVCDLDEHLHIDHIGEYLSGCRRRGITVVPARGYEMVTEQFPEAHETLAVTRRRGAPAPEMSKLAVFQPDAIEELGHAPGGHESTPVGRVVAPARDALLLLHYKYLGSDYIVSRDGELRGRLGAGDRAKGWARHWNDAPETARAVLERINHDAVDVSTLSPFAGSVGDAHTWWRRTLPRLADVEQLDALDRERGQLASALEGVRRASQEQGVRLETAERDLMATADEAARLRDERAALEATVTATRARVEAIENSRTWRWSRPVRALVDVVLRLSKRAGTGDDPAPGEKR